MSNFSLRTQVFMFAGAFIAMLLAIAAVSWLSNQRLTSALAHSRHVTTQLKSLDDMKEDIEQGIGDLLSFAAGKADGVERLRGNLQEVTDEIALAPGRFKEVALVESRDEKALKALVGLQDMITALDGDIAKYAGTAPEERSAAAMQTMLPKIGALRDVVNELQDSVGARNVKVQAEVDALITQIERLQLGISLLAAIAAVGFAVIFGKKLSQPVLRAAEVIKALADQDYSSEITGTTRKDEMGAIARNLQDLTARLEEAETAEENTRRENARRGELFDSLGLAMSGLKNGDLDQVLEPAEWSDLGQGTRTLCEDFNALAASLSELVGQLNNSSQVVADNAREMERMSDRMSQRAETQAATLEESAAALEQMAASVQSSAEQAQAADREVEEGRRRAEQGGAVMEQARQAMSSIADYSSQISQIITSIDDIAFQTSLLALNAGVEAARAGEAGRGFAVVASEVRGLALKAAKSASEIKQLVEDSSNQVSEGERLVQATADTLGKIVESVTNVSGMVSAIANSSSEQASGIKEINIGVAQLDKVTQENAAMVQETYGASQEMRTQATRLSDLLQGFMGSAQVDHSRAA